MNQTTVSAEPWLGFRLKRDIYSGTGALLLPAHAVLTRENLAKLRLHRLALEPEDLAAPAATDDACAPRHELVEEAVSSVREIFDTIREKRRIPVMELRRHVLPLVFEATEQPDLFKLFAAIQAKDDYTYRHNIGVAVLSALLGRWLRMEKTELARMTLAAALHDVGKTAIPLDILNKPGRLNEEEFTRMKRHTVIGYEMLKETVGITHRQALVALQHHERQDGSGYPFGSKGAKLDAFSRIVAVADVFHAMSSRRVYRDPAPFYDILKQMHRGAFGEFDPLVIRVFLGKMMQSLIGNEVLLTDGRTGRIVLIHANDPLHPLVQLDEGFVDLARTQRVAINRVVG